MINRFEDMVHTWFLVHRHPWIVCQNMSSELDIRAFHSRRIFFVHKGVCGSGFFDMWKLCVFFISRKIFRGRAAGKSVFVIEREGLNFSQYKKREVWLKPTLLRCFALSLAQFFLEVSVKRKLPRKPAKYFCVFISIHYAYLRLAFTNSLLFWNALKQLKLKYSFLVFE
jgi:hypothetical protein